MRIIADLDALIDQYEKLGAPTDAAQPRSDLLASIDQIIAAKPCSYDIKTEKRKDLCAKSTFRDRYEQCKSVAERLVNGGTANEEKRHMFCQLFAEEQNLRRSVVLASDPTVRTAKESLLASLRNHGVCVLSKGSIEDYYPTLCDGSDKPSKALSACTKVSTPQDARALCASVNDGQSNERPELELIFEAVFANL